MMTKSTERMIHHHLVVGWTVIALWGLFGLGLEAMHGLKLGFYLDLDAATRRHMWGLAHAHGTLLGLLHVGAAMTIKGNPGVAQTRAGQWGGKLLLVAAVLMPLGFLLGGLWFYAGDPGPGVLLVPLGGFALVAAAVLLALACRDRGPDVVVGTGGDRDGRVGVGRR